ncbi:hypothetical protein GCM10009612_62320 [Streptomyces beijiangensis]
MFSLTLYRDGESDNRCPGGAPVPTGPEQHMKTTMILRSTANPRRTTLMHLADAEGLHRPEQPEHSLELPTQTANPRRTILMEAPVTAAAI